MGYYYNKDSDDLREAVESTPESALYGTFYEDCLKKGIERANALFIIQEMKKSVNENKKYNDLTFIGVYDWE